MKRIFLITSTALLLCQTPTLAQTAAPNTTTAPSAGASETSSQTGVPLRDHIRDMLQKSGFTDIRVMPSSFMIRAKDQDGNPVVMSVSPDSVTEIAQLGTNDRAGSSGLAENGTAANSDGQQFVPVQQNDKLSSNLIGLDVYNSSNQNVGQIKDIAVGPQGRARALILSVGGLLGVGTHYVAMNPRDVQISYNNSDQKWHATTSATTEQLKSAPEFQYNGRWNASKS